MKRKLSIFLIFVMSIMLFSSCNEIDEELTFTVLFTDINAKIAWGNDEISKEIKRRTGVNLEIEVINTDTTSKIDKMIKQDNLPDMIFSVDNDIISELANKNLLYSIDEYITPDTNIYKIFGDDLKYMSSETDGKIYGVNRQYKGVTSYSDATFFIQYAVLEYFNYPDLNNLTLDDYYNMLDEYKKEFKYINNEETIGLSCWGDSYGMNISINNPALRSGGYENDGFYVVNDNLDVEYGLKTDEANNFLLFLNKMYNNDLFDKDAIVQDRAQFYEKVTSGAVLSVMTESWDLADSESALRANGLSDRCYMPVPIKQTEDTDLTNISNYDDKGTWKSVITKSCKNPEKAFKFFDTMWSDDMQILVNWGIEGIHYDIVEGKKQIKQSVIDEVLYNPDWKSDTGLTIYCMWGYGSEVLDKNNEYYNYFTSIEFSSKCVDQETKEIMEIYNIDSFKDLCPPPKIAPHTYVWKLNLDKNSPGAVAETYVNDILRRIYIPKLVFAESLTEFNTTWQTFMDEIDSTNINLREQEIRNKLLLELE